MSRRQYPNRRHIDLDLGPERHRRRLLNRVSLSIAAIFILIVAGTTLLPDLAGAPTEDEASTAPAGTPLVPVEGATLVEVDRIIDGDTLAVRAFGGELLTVRLYGVDTPERGDACFAEATARLQELAGDQVQLLPDARQQDPFERELRYVYTTDGVLIDKQLVAEGFGLAWREDGQYADRIVEVEEEARAESRGCLWAD